MPEYTYLCSSCGLKFNIVCSISSYKECIKCNGCFLKKAERAYIDDLASMNMSIKKSDSELKTIGDIANRNRDKLSNDQKSSLDMKHNDYKYNQEDNPLPKGMSRMKNKRK
jgi:hypothetical protein